MTRKLNLDFLMDVSKHGSGAALAFLYEEIAGAAVVNATAQDNKISPFDFAMQMLVGWGPLVFAAYYPGQFTASFAGATIFNRIDNLAVTGFGARAQSPMGPIMKGETLLQAQARMGAVTG